MRSVYDPTTGADVTAAAQSLLLANDSIPLTDLFWFQYIDPSANTLTPVNLFMTGAPYPVKVGKLQVTAGQSGVQTVNAVYRPSRIKRSAFNYEVGFQDQTCDVIWDTDDTINISTLPWGFKHALLAGYFDEYPFWIHQAIFSAPGALLGTTLKWRGFVRDVKADRSTVTITLASLMDIFQQTQIPTQLIQPGSRLPPFFAAGNASVIGGSLGGSFSNLSTPMDIQFNTLAGPFAPIADHALRDCFLTSVNNPPPAWKTAQSGQPFAQIFRIRDNVTDGSGILHIYPYEPIDPVSMLGGFGSVYMNFYSQSEIGLTGAVAPGMPFVPPPETGI